MVCTSWTMPYRSMKFVHQSTSTDDDDDDGGGGGGDGNVYNDDTQ